MNDAGASSEPKERTAEQKAKWAAYIRSYRKRKKLAAGHLIAIENSEVSPEPQSCDSGLPDAA